MPVTPYFILFFSFSLCLVAKNFCLGKGKKVKMISFENWFCVFMSVGPKTIV